MAAPPNNKYNQKYTEEEVREIFIKAQENAENDPEILCLEDAIFSTGMPYSTYYWYSAKSEDLEQIKNDTKKAIIRRINSGTLLNRMNATAGIWRSKMLGESETQNISVTGGSIDISAWIANQTKEENE
jgi:hypothetical protein